MNKTVLLGIIFIVVFIGIVVLSTRGSRQYRCEICVAFQGRSACRTAAASTRDHALRTAIENACAQISSGVGDTTACQSTPPVSIKWLSEP